MTDLAVRASHQAFLRLRRRAAGGQVKGYDAGGAPDQDFTTRTDQPQTADYGVPGTYFQPGGPAHVLVQPGAPEEAQVEQVAARKPMAPIPELEVLRQQQQSFQPFNPMQPGGGRVWTRGPDVVPPVGPPTGGGDRISPRLPTGTKSTEDPLGDKRLQIDLESMKNTPAVYNKAADLIREYPNLTAKEAKGSADQVHEALINHATNNILWLHDQVPPEIGQRSQLWYDGGRALADRFSQTYNVDPKSSAAVIATQSPQRDWYRNVDLAQRIHDITLTKADQPWSPEMTAEAAAPYYAKGKIAPLVQAVQGKSYKDLTDPTLKALWVRMYDMAHNSSDYHLVTPEGEFGAPVTSTTGENAKRAWSGSLDEISRGIQALEANGDLSKISPLLGGQHKVRSFYNNIIDPNSPEGDVTIDTHAVAAALLRPLSGTSLEVDHNFGKSSEAGRANPGGSDVTGVRGMYPLYAEAYRRAAAARGILPRQMQSITWEAVRGLFSPSFKARDDGAIDRVWQGYQKGLYSLDDARSQILNLAGGIEPPSWFRPASAAGDNAAVRSPGDAGKLPGAGVPGGAAAAVERGARSGAPAAAAGAAPGAVGGRSLEEAQAEAARIGGPRVPLAGLPRGPFTLAGEENAWRSHSAMYSDLARPAMTSETRGQNSWLNYGPHGDKNRTAKSADTIYADQKVGLLPQWAIDEGRFDAPSGLSFWSEPPRRRAVGGAVTPSPAQAKAGNYKKAHIVFQGLPISLENMRGSMRRGVGRGGKPWSVKMPAHYGYFKRSNGADGDQVDAYVGPHKDSRRVFIVNQHDADTKEFDEHKVMVGFTSKQQAQACYDRGFSDGRGHERRHSIVETTIDDLKERLKDPKAFKKSIKRATGGRVGYQEGGAPGQSDEEAGLMTGSSDEEAGLISAGPTAHARYRAGVKALAQGAPEQPAGAGAEEPTYPKPQPAAETLAQYGQVGKGLAKGIPATLSGGVLGDIETTGRTLLRPFAPGVSEETKLPTTTEGGYLGPKGLGAMAPAATPEEAAGMTLSSALIPGLKKVPGAFRRAPPASAAEMAPFEMHPQAPTPTVRPDNGARLLPPNVPHELPPETPTTVPKEPGRAGVGAQAARGPLAEVSPTTIDHLRNVLAEEQFTPWSLEQRLDEMSPHQFLGEVTPNTETRMSGLASFPGQSRTEIVNAVRGRAAEQGERLRELLNNAFGPAEDLSQNRRLLEIQQQQQAGPLYRAFREVQIPPTDEMLALMPRLRAAGAIGQARRLAAIEGIPWDTAFDTLGTAEMQRSPTASSWDLMKRGLDSRIEASRGEFGKATNLTRVLTGLRADLFSAIENHPDARIGQMWRLARQTFAGPAEIKAAQQMGRGLLREGVDANELPFITAGYSQPQMMGLAQGMRAQFENLMGRAGPQGRRTINQVLSQNNQQKIRWVIGDQAADQLFSGFEKEQAMHDAPTRLVGGSPTASRVAAQADYAAKPPLLSPQNAFRVGRAFLHPAHAVGHEAAGLIGRRMNQVNEARAAQLREETSRLMTLQGPERDAVLRWLAFPDGVAGRGP